MTPHVRTRRSPTIVRLGTVLVATAVLCALAGKAHATVVWPPSDTWTAIAAGGSPVTDPDGTTPDDVDIRGTTSFPAGFAAYDLTRGNLLFRVRVDQAPTTPTRVWQILIDSDGDGDADWSLQLDHASGSVVELVSATTGGPTFDDLVFAASGAFSGAASVYSRFVATGDGNQFGSVADAFVDIAIPTSAFATNTGLSTTDAFRVALATSTFGTLVNRDRPGGATGASLVNSAWSDAFSIADVQAIPEPGTWALFGLGAGILAWRRRRQRTSSDAARARAAS